MRATYLHAGEVTAAVWELRIFLVSPSQSICPGEEPEGRELGHRKSQCRLLRRVEISSFVFPFYFHSWTEVRSAWGEMTPSWLR